MSSSVKEIIQKVINDDYKSLLSLPFNKEVMKSHLCSKWILTGATRGWNLWNFASTDLDPVNEASDLLPHCLGVLSCNHIVVLGRGEPVHHDNVSHLLSLVQRRHQLCHPAFKHTTQLLRWQIKHWTYNVTRHCNKLIGTYNIKIQGSSGRMSLYNVHIFKSKPLSDHLYRTY